jgi:dihydrofolate reductase
MTRPVIQLVAAVARNGVIGDGGDLIWRIPEDLAHFRRVTTGCPVAMGRRTWLSMPPRLRPLAAGASA